LPVNRPIGQPKQTKSTDRGTIDRSVDRSAKQGQPRFGDQLSTARSTSSCAFTMHVGWSTGQSTDLPQKPFSR